MCERIQRHRGRVTLVVVALTALQPFAMAAALGDPSFPRRTLPLLRAMLPLLALAAADDVVGIAWRPDAGGTRVLLLTAH